eukprot:gb/GECG01007932.1/.p1 GENE.gb/GECG01007932.1/~~gb/GECG01007932.1/.p1  ORF type:complete len:240 (+),score=43.34 gb/GECG01007932.1/:1-720(+)
MEMMRNIRQSRQWFSSMAAHSGALQQLHNAGFRRVIGLTGSIGTGKSHAREHIESLGCLCVDADKLAHSVYEPGTEGYDRVCEHFGAANVLDESGNIDRKKLGSIVFGDPKQLKDLNSIVWPQMERKIVEELVDKIRELTPGQTKVIGLVEAAVLIEAGWDNAVDEVWLTMCSRNSQIGRVMERNQLSREDAEKRIDSQMSQEEKMKKADVTIDTSGPKEQTKAIIKQEFDTMLEERCV